MEKAALPCVAMTLVALGYSHVLLQEVATLLELLLLSASFAGWQIELSQMQFVMLA